MNPKSVIVFDQANQSELNKAIVYDCVVHDKLPLSRFNSAYWRRIFRGVGEVLTKYRMSLLGHNFEHILMANYNASRPEW